MASPKNAGLGRGLAAAAGAEEGDELAALDREVDVLDHGVGGEALAQMVELEEGHAGAIPSSAFRPRRRGRSAAAGPCRPR